MSEAEYLWVWRVEFWGDDDYMPVLVAAPDIKAAVDAAVDQTGIKHENVASARHIANVRLRYDPEAAAALPEFSEWRYALQTVIEPEAAESPLDKLEEER